MEPTTEQLAELKRIETEIFQVFIDICKKMKLRYYLLGGTLLGAVRHQGFIPWDDDIDVGMPREDYEVFLKKGPALMPENLFIQNIHSEPEYPMCFAKIRNSDTTFIETSIHHLKVNHGVYIDVFPLDYYPDHPKEQKKFDAKRKRYNRRLVSVFDIPGPVSILTRVKSLLLKIRYPSARAIVLKREVLYQAVPKSVMLANYGGAWGEKEIMPADWYGDGATLTFEGMQVNAPLQYEKWLTQVYGDYMQLPPVEKRVGHHFADVIDLQKPYTEYIRR